MEEFIATVIYWDVDTEMMYYDQSRKLKYYLRQVIKSWWKDETVFTRKDTFVSFWTDEQYKL